jgi:ubiquitin-protein ligase
MNASQFIANMLVVLLKLLDDADPKSPAAIEARKLLATKID